MKVKRHIIFIHMIICFSSPGTSDTSVLPNRGTVAQAESLGAQEFIILQLSKGVSVFHHHFKDIKTPNAVKVCLFFAKGG